MLSTIKGENFAQNASLLFVLIIPTISREVNLRQTKSYYRQSHSTRNKTKPHDTMSLRRESSKKGRPSRFVEHIDGNAGPAKTFEDMNMEPGQIREASPPRKRMSLKRLSTSVRSFVSGSTKREGSQKAKAKAPTKNGETSGERAQLTTFELRQRALSGEHLDEESLHRLARAEYVYLNPRASRKDRFLGDDYHLDSGLVARLSGRLPNEMYVFLGSNSYLYISRHSMGRHAKAVSSKAESEYREYREVARAYYQLCSSRLWPGSYM